MQGAVRTVCVVVIDELAEHVLEVATVQDMSQSRHSRRTVPTKRSAIAFAFRARTGVLITSMSSLAKTASKSRVYLASRSRIRKRKRDGCSWSAQVNWRAC
jgi:hypothetical protein